MMNEKEISVKERKTIMSKNVISEREFWLIVRSALIMAVRAIEKRFGLNQHVF